MIDTQLRAKGIGSTDIAQLLGMSPYGDAFAVYARKLGLVEESEPTLRQRRGTYFEQGIANWYSDTSGNAIEWFNKTIQHPQREWQVASPDFWVVDPEKSMERIGGGDSKLVSWTEAHAWGDAGTDEIPDHYALQMQWLMSASEMPWWDVAACLGDNLQIYRIQRDPEIEATLLEVAERFWTENVLKQVAPPIGHSDTAARYIKQRFPRNAEVIREATPEEVDLLFRYKNECAVLAEAKSRADSLANEVRLIIGEADGVKDPVLGKVTWKRIKDTIGPDYKAIAEHLWSDLRQLFDAALKETDHPPDSELEPLSAYCELHRRVLREGTRRLLVPRTWKTEAEEE